MHTSLKKTNTDPHWFQRHESPTHFYFTQAAFIRRWGFLKKKNTTDSTRFNVVITFVFDSLFYYADYFFSKLCKSLLIPFCLLILQKRSRPHSVSVCKSEFCVCPMFVYLYLRLDFSWYSIVSTCDRFHLRVWGGRICPTTHCACHERRLSSLGPTPQGERIQICTPPSLPAVAYRGCMQILSPPPLPPLWEPKAIEDYLFPSL